MINANGQFVYNTRNNSCGTKLFKLPIKKLNIQSRNINNYDNSLLNSKNIQKNSLYSTKEATPRKEQNKVLTKVLTTGKHKDTTDPLDDTLSQITDILQKNKKNLNYSELVGKIPGLNDEPNFVFNQVLYNKSKINKAKKLSQKIGVLKLPITNINNISSKETLSNSDRSKQYFSKRVKDGENSNKKNKEKGDSVEVSCCFFGRK